MRTLDKPFGFLILKPSGVRFADVSFRNYLVNSVVLDLSGLCIAGVVASRAQWRFGIFTVWLQMAIKLNQVKYQCGHNLRNAHSRHRTSYAVFQIEKRCADFYNQNFISPAESGPGCNSMDALTQLR